MEEEHISKNYIEKIKFIYKICTLSYRIFHDNCNIINVILLNQLQLVIIQINYQYVINKICIE